MSPKPRPSPMPGRGVAEELDQPVRERRDALPVRGAPRRVPLEQLRGADIGRRARALRCAQPRRR